MEHLDLDALADVLAGEPAPAHLAGCAECTQLLAELRAADALVLAQLTTLPLPELPADLDARISRALLAERPAGRTASATVTPLSPRKQRNWLPAAGGIAAAVAFVFGGVLLLQHSGSSGDAKSTASAPKATSEGAGAIAVSDTGTDYLADNVALKRNLPTLLGAPKDLITAPQAPSAVATDSSTRTLTTLRTPSGLAACLASLSDPSSPGVPLAVDYAQFKGKPALVVVLPSAKEGKVDVFIVPADCPTGGTLYEYVRLDKP
jgi:hypothetical protein